MHVLNVGASGWGKSTWLRAFVWQLDMAQEPVNVVAVDVSGSEFNLLRHWEKLLYPVARTTQDAVAVLNEVSGEMDRRRELFEAVPLASSLTEYNRLTGQGLPPLVVLADEGAALLNEGKTGEYLRDAIQTARQYGIYCLLATVTATHRTIDTGIRDQFSTRLCFRTSPSSSGVVLDDRRAGDLNAKGRAWVLLSGRELVEVQGPWVSRNDLIRALQPGGPVGETPATADQKADDQAAAIRARRAEGVSLNQIQQEFFGYVGGAAFAAVKAALGEGEG
jgi:DNA segregation ATPase FtsK/SpoIIIE-like protein